MLNSTAITATAITTTEYRGLQQAYDHFNFELLDGKLPDVMITLQRRANSYGHFSPDQFSSRAGNFVKHELNLNPDGFRDRSDEQICSTLAHEMVHVWQEVFGKPSKGGYHNRQWAEQMKAIGLQPSATGLPGGKETGPQVSHYILADGRFARAYSALATTGWKLNLESARQRGQLNGGQPNGDQPSGGKDGSKTKFTCLRCGANCWGKSSLEVDCRLCGLPLVSEAQMQATAQMRAAAQAQPETPAIPALTYSPTGGADVPTG
jgi:hypothetical protein